MKTFLGVMLSVAMVAILLLSNGCTGDNGNDGAVYARYSINSAVTRYWDNCSAALSYSYSQTSAGTYNFDFDRGGYTYYGTFTLVANAGEKGGPFFKKGKDGTDRYYTINVGSSSLWLSKQSDILNKIEGTPTPFDPTLPVITRADTVEGAIVVWEYQVRATQK